MNTNWRKIKLYRLSSLSNLNKPIRISDFFKAHGIEDYVYEIKCNNITMKYGMSMLTTAQIHGERLYRQIGHIPSWGDQMIDGSSGDEFVDIVQWFEHAWDLKVDHKNITVFVWDFTNYPYRTVNKKNEIEGAESELIKTYAKFYGALPIGNLKDGSEALRRSAPILDVYKTMFEETV